MFPDGLHEILNVWCNCTLATELLIVFEKDRSSDFLVAWCSCGEVQVRNYTNRNFISTAQKHDLTKCTVSRSMFNEDQKSILKNFFRGDSGWVN